MRPDALPAQRHMQPALGPFRIAAAWLHRIDDDAVVADLQPDAARSLGKCRLYLSFIPHAPIKGAVVGGLRMQGLAAGGEVHLGRQVISVE